MIFPVKHATLCILLKTTMELLDTSNLAVYLWLIAGFFLGILFSLVLARTGILFFSKKWEDMSGKALYKNTEQFLSVAEKYFSGYVGQARQDFKTRNSQIQETITPIRHTLDQYAARLQVMENQRERAYGEIGEKLSSLNRETLQLANALKKPHVRGRWGEITLQRVMELSGMTEHCDFVQQPTVDGENGRLRPDMVITLPSNRKIIVDAKAPLDAYLEAQQAGTPEEAKQLMKRHAAQIMTHVKQLGGKKYQAHFNFSPEFVVLFLPGENFFMAALNHDPELIEKAVRQDVILCTPTTLIALFKTVSHCWLQEKTYENAEAIRGLGTQLYQRLFTMADTMNQLGKNIEKSCESFNRLTGAMEKRVLPGAKKLKDMALESSAPDISLASPLESVMKTMKQKEAKDEE